MASQKVIYAKFLQELRECPNYNEVIQGLNSSTNSLPKIFESIWTHPLTDKIVNLPEGDSNINKKGQAESEHFRNVGNRLYKEKKLEKALLAYNYAILSAPHPLENFSSSAETNNEEQCLFPDFECLSFAYANRSVLLVDMNQHQPALDDISSSVRYGYPDSKKYKLFERKCKCLIALGKYNEASELLGKLTVLIENTKLEKKEADAVKNNVQKLKMKCSDYLNKKANMNNKAEDDRNAEINEKYEKLFYRGSLNLPQVSNPRKKYPTVSQAVKVKFSNTKGRHLIATRDIEPGKLSDSNNILLKLKMFIYLL